MWIRRDILGPLSHPLACPGTPSDERVPPFAAVPREPFGKMERVFPAFFVDALLAVDAPLRPCPFPGRVWNLSSMNVGRRCLVVGIGLIGSWSAFLVAILRGCCVSLLQAGGSRPPRACPEKRAMPQRKPPLSFSYKMSIAVSRSMCGFLVMT